MPFVDSLKFKAGMSHVAGAVWVVTTLHEGLPWGLTATAVCSFTAEPPTLLACVNRDSDAHSRIVASRRLCLNLMRASQSDIASRFSGRDGHKAQARFDGVPWHFSPSGVPMLDGCLANFDCELVSSYDARSHTAFVCGVMEVEDSTETGRDPLIYFRRDFTTIQAPLSQNAA